MTGHEVKEKLRIEGIALTELAEKLGISNQALSNRLTRKYFKPEYLEAINTAVGRNIFNTDQTYVGIPIYDIRVCAGNGIGIEESEKILDYVNIPIFRGCFGLQVYGDSMRGRYNSGDIIFIRPCLNDTPIEYGRSYVIITDDDIMVKMLYPTRNTNTIRISSYNAELTPSGDRAYPDRDIHINDIRKLYKVVGRLEHETI